MMPLLNLIHLMKIHTRIVHLSCNYFETISHYGQVMLLMPMKQIHQKNISKNCFVYIFPSSCLFVCVQHTHIQTYNRSPTNLTKQQKKTFFFLLFFFSLNTSINYASLYFYSFVDVNCLFFFLYLCVCVGYNHYFLLFFFFISCLFIFFFKLFVLFMCCLV